MKLSHPSRVASWVLLAALLGAHTPTALFAQSVSADHLARASLEELMNMRITSAERKTQRAEDVPAAVYVITQEDIRRSGLTKLPEIFRLVPGVQVARVNASEWAVSVRGFNSLYSDKLLVLIDGRSLYNRAFSGVFWDGQNVMASDIDRIEVIRGPGGTAWGANAVNGVINVITKSAADTQGVLVDVSAGTFERDSGGIRYGGTAGNLAYRAYSQWSDHADGRTDAGTHANDGWRALTTGLRTDWSRDADSVMVEAGYTKTEAKPGWLVHSNFIDAPSSAGSSDLDEATVIGRWTHRVSNGSLFQVQAFNTVNHRDETTLYAAERTTDVDAQYQAKVGSHQEFVAGGGYRRSALTTRESFGLSVPSDTAQVVNAFIQDEISLSSAVKVTLGSKFEHDTFAGWGLLPSARVMWNVDPLHQRAWAAVSRARRTPSATYRGMKIYSAVIPAENGVPVVIGVIGNPDYRSEELLQAEAGYRYQFGSTASIDVTVFDGHYNHSTTLEALAPAFELTPAPAHVLVSLQYANLLDVGSRGFEIAAHWAPVSTWRLDGSYSGLRLSPHVDPASQDPAAGTFDGSAPQHQWQLHSTTWLTTRAEADAGVYFVGRLREMNVPAYTRVDARFEFKLTKQLAAMAVGQNLFQSVHQEISSVNTGLVGSLVPRSGRVQLRWQF
jgi:iron complex outermembrane receptor protein